MGEYLFRPCAVDTVDLTRGVPTGGTAHRQALSGLRTCWAITP